jgi:hypothetical protein
MVSRGIAIADVDGDGRLDFVCANQWGPSYFFKNESPQAGAFLGLRLVQGKGSPAIGAVATVNLADGRKVGSQVDGGSGHSGGAVRIFTLAWAPLRNQNRCSGNQMAQHGGKDSAKDTAIGSWLAYR